MGKKLVAYFSASGTTAELAKRLADGIGADLYEIEPEIKYNSADLNWMDENARSTKEMKDRASRPAIKGRVDHMEQYDTVFVGFPIWWYREPSIIDTFMESEDFAGKKVIPFATSGMSPIGEAGENLQKLAPKAHVEKGMRFDANASKEQLQKWAEQF